MLACCAHGHVLSLEFALFVPASFAEEEHPGAVNGPVAEGAIAGEVEGAGCEGVGEVVADVCWRVVSSWVLEWCSFSSRWNSSEARERDSGGSKLTDAGILNGTSLLPLL